MKLLTARRWLTVAALVTGTTFQLTNCRDESSMFLTRSIFSSVFVPINQSIVFIFQIIASSIPSVSSLFGS